MIFEEFFKGVVVFAAPAAWQKYQNLRQLLFAQQQCSAGAPFLSFNRTRCFVKDRGFDCSGCSNVRGIKSQVLAGCAARIFAPVSKHV
jgi:hypothetical protein